MRLRTTAIGLTAAALLTGLAIVPAHATPPAPRDLPPVGEDDYLNLNGTISFSINGEPCTATLNGDIDEEVTNSDPGTDELDESGFTMSGADACGLAQSSDGSITIEQDNVDVSPTSLLRITQQYPPEYEQTMVLDFTMTIDEPQDLSGHAGRGPVEPLVLTTKDPATLIGKLTQFPPKGDLYQLQNPVDLIDVENPDITIATIEKFPVKVGGL